MDNRELKTLLEKYWQGETSLEEEKSLKKWFANNSGHEGLENEEVLFKHFQKTGEIELPGDFEDKILEKIDADKSKTIIWGSRLLNWKAAAVISGIIVASIVLKNPFGSSTQMTDTYENPQDAYEATKAILMTISSNMNKGKKYTRQLSKFSEAQEKVSEVGIEAIEDGS